MPWFLFKNDSNTDLIEIRNSGIKFLKPVTDVDSFAEDLFQCTLRELSSYLIKIPLNKSLFFEIEGKTILDIKKNSYDLNIENPTLSGKEWEVILEYIRLVQRKLIK